MNESQRLLRRNLALKSLFWFNELIIMPASIPSQDRLFLTENIHKPFLEFADDDSLYRKGFLMPRYFLKSSSLTKAKPILDWLRNPEERILIANEVFLKASEFLGYIRKQFESNERLHYYFPESKISKDWQFRHQWSNKGIELPCEGIYDVPTVSPIGVGGARQGGHFSRIYLDDLIGKKAMMSMVIRQDTETWFNSVPELLVNPYKNWIYLLGTNWGPGDIYESVKRRKLGYKWITFAAEDETGNATWPEKLPQKEIEAMKADPSRFIIYYTQFCNNPMETDLTDFKPSWLKYYELITIKDEHTGEDVVACRFIIKDRENETEKIIPVNDLEIEAVIDPAGFTEGGVKRTARNAITVIGTDPETHKHIILEAWAKYLSEPDQLYQQVAFYHKKYPVRRWHIEVFGTQGTIQKVIREKSREDGIYIPMSELPRDVGKNAKDIRIRSLQDDFATGGIYLREDMTDLIGEYLAFPMGTTEDLMDCLGYAKLSWSKADKKSLSRQSEAEYQRYKRSINPITGY